MPGQRCEHDTARNLLHRLDNVDACERQSERAADPLDRRRGPHHERPGDRRRMKRLAPEHRRELRSMKQVAKLGFRIGQALSVRRAVRARPNAPAGGHDHDHSSFRRGNAPQFFKQRVRPIRGLQRGATTAGRWSRQAAATFASTSAAAQRPASGQIATPCSAGIKARHRRAPSRNGRDTARRNLPRRSRGRRCYPSAHGHAPDQPAGDAAERRAVEALRTQDVERHRYRPEGPMTLNERPTFRNAPRRGSARKNKAPRRDRDRPPGYKERAVRARVWLKRRAKPENRRRKSPSVIAYDDQHPSVFVSYGQLRRPRATTLRPGRPRASSSGTRSTILAPFLADRGWTLTDNS